jgi:GT2 family glycosyltransferase/glycosyltransferase involved in cell wall biosynthesis
LQDDRSAFVRAVVEEILTSQPDAALDVSIVIPVLNKLEFTTRCLDRIERNTGTEVSYEVIIVDNGSTDGTLEWFSKEWLSAAALRYHRNPSNLGFAKGNNIGARLARGRNLLFLNNDTLVQPGWLEEMLRVLRAKPAVGIVGIKQLFPYTNVLYHTGIVFAAGGVPQHIYPHLDAGLAHVNQERSYQAVTGACLLIPRALFDEVGGFDEGYVNGYEDIDLCMTVAERKRTIVCCTSAFIYHYGQISEGRTADDDENAARFARKWAGRIHVDQDEYLAKDRAAFGPLPSLPSSTPVARDLPDDAIYLADDLRDGSAATWANADLALALDDLGVPVFVNGAGFSPTMAVAARKRLERLTLRNPPTGGVQIKWSHYRPQHLHLELAGSCDLEFFVINYLFQSPGSQPWDYWLQCLRGNGRHKLPDSTFCKSVLAQVGVSDADCHVVPHGYSREVGDVDPPSRRDSNYRFLTVTNSHDLGRYNTDAIIDAFERTFTAADDVVLVIKDYGASSGDRTLRERLARRNGTARIEYLAQFTGKRELIALYKSADAFVSAHRGEGFGMKILDAMACGLPVITPLFGGPTDYCTPQNCLTVDFTLVPMGDCLDTRALKITNAPHWAEVDVRSLGDQMRRARTAPKDAAALGQRGRDSVIDRFTWEQAAAALITATETVRSRKSRPPRPASFPAGPPSERSRYWLGLRVSVVVPTHNRREKLATCLEALRRQSILPQEFEVIVVDDGSTDDTGQWLAQQVFPFRLRVVQQEGSGPGAARNRGLEEASGELVLFIGDDIYADERLLEEHLLGHANAPDLGVAMLGHIDWPRGIHPTAVMDYVCGDAMLQFAYSYIPTAPSLDHRFFYTSNVSLKRRFLAEAAADGIRFDPAFYNAAFEDSELAYRLIPRGLELRYAPRALAFHDHPMDLPSFAAREFRAGEMAVVFYRKHPAEDPHLQVQWLADLAEPVETLIRQPDVLRSLEAFDTQTDALLKATAESLDTMLSLQGQLRNGVADLSAERVRAGLNNVFRVVFDVQRTRGKVREWYGSVDDTARTSAAQAFAAVLRKVEFLGTTSASMATLPLASVPGGNGSFATGVVAPSRGVVNGPRLDVRLARRLRRLVDRPAIRGRLVAADRRIQATLRRAWLTRYQQLRTRLRRALLP